MQSMRFGQRVPDVDDASAAAGERLAAPRISSRWVPGDSLVSAKQRVEAPLAYRAGSDSIE